MIAHIMITNVNKSEYVTILPSSYIKTRRSRRNRPPAAWVNILYCQCVTRENKNFYENKREQTTGIEPAENVL